MALDVFLQAGGISAPLQVIIDRVVTFTTHEICVILGVYEDMRKLERILERIRAMVGQIEQNVSITSTELWKMWLEDVEALSYSADDLLDSVSLYLLKHGANLSADAEGGQQLRNTIASSLKFTTLPRKINEIRKKLEDLVKEVDAVYMAELTKLGSDKCVKPIGACSSYSCATSSMVSEGSVIGREKEIGLLIDVLLSEGSNETNVSVVPVVGIGGIGKTSLAQLVYNHEDIAGRFAMRMWASVSTNFDPIGIMKSIIESASRKCCKLSDLDAVQVKLHRLIAGKRFLLVLDDYWSERYKDWEVLSAPFKSGAKGSKIILTTRSMMVSDIVGTVRCINLECLSDENCWEIMKQRASPNGTLDVQLEEIGNEIAEKCKGLPLAAKSLGSMLRFKGDPADWTYILESEIWDIPFEENDVFPALSLSYHHLPAPLKKCFTYCSLFPKNYEFKMNELVLLWMAQGFVHSTGKMRVEDVGVNYFKNLLWRSFFQRSGVDNHGRDIYKMHDLIHSMAQFISSQSCLCLESNQPNHFKNTRHFSLRASCRGAQPVDLTVCSWYKNLRTFRVTGRIKVRYDLFSELKLLRVLDLSRTGLDDLPDSIENLEHLRFLNLSENGFIKLPESLANLIGLQTLKLEECCQLLTLPEDMKNMVSLRHLLMDIKQLNSMPEEFGKLVDLQSLSAFIVGESEKRGIGELGNMNFLRGCICIKNLENVRSINDAGKAMLHTKPFLDKLELEWKASGSRVIDGDILAGLRPHENLKEFVMTNYGGFLLPGWFLDPSFRKLSSISLLRCKHHQILSTLGNLQHLKSLAVIEDMSKWKLVDQEFDGFPSLENLTIKEIPNLTEWNPLVGNRSRFPQLLTLSIDDCPKLTNLPSLLGTTLLYLLDLNRCPKISCLPADGLPSSLQSFKITGCDILKDRCVDEGADWEKIRLVPMRQIE